MIRYVAAFNRSHRRSRGEISHHFDSSSWLIGGNGEVVCPDVECLEVLVRCRSAVKKPDDVEVDFQEFP